MTAERFNSIPFYRQLIRRGLFASYIFAGLTVVAATAATLTIPAIGQRAVFLLYFFAIIQSAFWFGRKPAVLATILSLVCINTLVLYPSWLTAPGDTWILTVGFGLLAAVFIKTLGSHWQLTQALYESRQDLAHAQAIGKTGSWRMNVQTNELTWSDENHRIFGIPKGVPLTYQHFISFIHPDDRDYVDKKWQAALKGEPYDIEHRILVSGKIKWVRETAVLEFDAQGALLGGFGTTSDIDERKRTETELLQSRQRYASIIDSAMDAVITVDEQHRILVFNPAAEKLFGYTSAEITGSPLSRLIPELFRNGHRERITFFSGSQGLSGLSGTLGIMTGLKKNGEEFPIEASISQVDVHGEKSFTVILRDITERLAAEMALKHQYELQNQLANVAESVPGLICSFRLSPDGVSSMPYASSRFKSIYGLNPEEVAQDFSPIFARIHNEDSGPLKKNIAESARCLQPWRDSFRYLHPEKGEIWIEGHSIPHTETDGAIVWHGYIQDVTDRKRVEAELKERIARYELVLNGAQDAIWDWDIRNKRVHFSPRWKELRGYAENEISDSEDEWSLRIHPDDKAYVFAALESLLQGLSPVYCEEYRIQTKDGSWKWVLDRGIAERDSDGQAVRMAGSESDITERKTTEAIIQEREMELKLIIDATPALISYLDTGFRYKRVNKTYRDWFGFPEEDIIGRTVLEIIGVHAWEIVKPYLERARAGEHVCFDYQIPYGAGKPRWVHVNYMPNSDAAGQVIGIVIHVVDIDERIQTEEKIKILNKNLQRSVDEMRAIFETVPVGLAIADDASGFRIHGNTLNTKLLGMAPGSELSKAGPESAPYQVMSGGRKLEIAELPMQRAVRGESVVNQVLDIHRSDGQVVTILSTAVPLFNENGTPRGAVGAFQDITDLKKTEAALHKSEEQLRLTAEEHLKQLQAHQAELQAQNIQLQSASAALEISRSHYLELYDFAPVPYLTLNAEGVIEEANLSAAALLGEQRAALEHSRFADYIPEQAKDVWNRYLTKDRQTRLELTLRRKDGNTLYVLLDGEERCAENRPPQLRISLTDITEKTLATIALNESEARLALGIQVANLAVIEIDYTTAQIRLSAEAARMFDLGATDICLPYSKTADRGIANKHSEFLRFIDEAISHADDNPTGADRQFYCRERSVRWLRVRIQSICTGQSGAERTDKVLLAVHDITKEKLASEAVKASELFVRTVLNSLPEHVVVLDHAGTVKAVNEPWERFASENDGTSSHVSAGANYLDVCRQAYASGDTDAKRALDGLEDLLAGNREEFVMEYACPSQGRTLWFLMHARRVNHETIGAILTHMDITEHRRTEAALHESEVRLALIVEEVKAGYWDWDLHANTIYFSPEWKRQIGFNNDEFDNRREEWDNRLHPDDRETVVKETENFIAGRQPAFELQYRLRHQNGSYRWIHSRGALLRNQESQPVRMLGINLDITDYVNNLELNERRDEMEKSFRLYVASQTAAAIAHELNQPLTAISYYAYVAQDLLSSGNRNPEKLALVMEKCGQQAQRAGEVIQQLLAFLHKGESPAEPLDVNKSVRYAIELVLANSHISTSKFALNLTEDLPPVTANAMQVQKVLINLLNNALESMRDCGRTDGTITVTTGRSATSASMARVTVSDCGAGVPDAETLSKLFQPFYTSKSQGLGMGLAISRALIEAHGGKMWAEQNPVQGLSVHFTLPFVL